MQEFRLLSSWSSTSAMGEEVEGARGMRIVSEDYAKGETGSHWKVEKSWGSLQPSYNYEM